MIKICKNKKIFLLVLFVISIVLITGLTIFLKNNWTILILAGTTLFFLVLLRPKIGVFVLLFLQLGLMKSTTGLTSIETIFIILFIVTIIGWLLRLLLKKKATIVRSSLSLPVLLFLLFCVLSLFKASYNNVSILNWFTGWRVFLILALFFVILNEFKSKKELKWIIYSFLITTTLICLRDMFLFNQQGGFEIMFKAAGLEYASLFFIMSIPFSISIFLTTKKLLLKWLQVPLIIIYFLRLLISFMRSYFIAILSMSITFIIILMILKIFKNKELFFRIIILVILMCIILGTISLIFPEKINKITKDNIKRFVILKDFSSSQNISGVTHLVEIKAAWKYFLNQPLLGHGFGFRYQYYRPNQQSVNSLIVHFIPLFFLIKMGFVGVLLIAWFIVRVIALNWQVLKREKDMQWKLFEISIFINFAGLVVLSFFITNVLRIDSVFYVTLAMGIIAVIKRIQNKSNTIDCSAGLVKKHK